MRLWKHIIHVVVRVFAKRASTPSIIPEMISVPFAILTEVAKQLRMPLKI